MAPALKASAAKTTAKRDKPPSEHAIKTLVGHGLTLAQVKALSPTERNTLVTKAQNSSRDIQAAIGKVTGGKKPKPKPEPKKSQSTSSNRTFDINYD